MLTNLQTTGTSLNIRLQQNTNDIKALGDLVDNIAATIALAATGLTLLSEIDEAEKSIKSSRQR
jgi:hypothetical protein